MTRRRTSCDTCGRGMIDYPADVTTCVRCQDQSGRGLSQPLPPYPCHVTTPHEPHLHPVGKTDVERECPGVAGRSLSHLWKNDEERVLADVVQIAAELAREKPEYDEAITELVARVNAAFPMDDEAALAREESQ